MNRVFAAALIAHVITVTMVSCAKADNFCHPGNCARYSSTILPTDTLPKPGSPTESLLPVLLVAYHGKIDAKFGPTVEHFVRSRKLRIVVRSYDLDKISGKLKLAVDGISAKNFGTEPYLSLSGFGKSTPLRGTTDMTQVAQWLAAQMGQ